MKKTNLYLLQCACDSLGDAGRKSVRDAVAEIEALRAQVASLRAPEDDFRKRLADWYFEGSARYFEFAVDAEHGEMRRVTLGRADDSSTIAAKPNEGLTEKQREEVGGLIARKLFGCRLRVLDSGKVVIMQDYADEDELLARDIVRAALRDDDE